MTRATSSRAKTIRAFAAGSIFLAAFVGICMLPTNYLQLVVYAFVGFALASLIVGPLMSADTWLLVPASWGAAISALAFVSYVQRAQGAFTGGWVIGLLLGFFAICISVADQAGYDFRGRRAV